jgi:hypothetical protein
VEKEGTWMEGVNDTENGVETGRSRFTMWANNGDRGRNTDQKK